MHSRGSVVYLVIGAVFGLLGIGAAFEQNWLQAGVFLALAWIEIGLWVLGYGIGLKEITPEVSRAQVFLGIDSCFRHPYTSQHTLNIYRNFSTQDLPMDIYRCADRCPIIDEGGRAVVAQADAAVGGRTTKVVNTLPPGARSVEAGQLVDAIAAVP